MDLLRYCTAYHLNVKPCNAVINFLSFSLRVAFEFTYADYLPEVYTNYVSH